MALTTRTVALVVMYVWGTGYGVTALLVMVGVAEVDPAVRPPRTSVEARPRAPRSRRARPGPARRPGVALVALAVVDTILTAIRVDRRGGPVTRWSGQLLWRASHGGGRRRRSGPPPVTGVLITIAIVGMWALLALSGWYLLFSSDADAVVSATTGEAAGAWSRLYSTAYTLSTLGIGDYVPSGAPWQVLTGVASGFGFGIATLVITYLAGVASAVTAKRQLARAITGSGTSPQELVRRSCDGTRSHTVQDHLLNLMPLLHGVAEQHRAYPLISYFKSSDRETADVPAVALLHDTLAILSAARRVSRSTPSRGWTSRRRPCCGDGASARSCTTRGGAGATSTRARGGRRRPDRARPAHPRPRSRRRP